MSLIAITMGCPVGIGPEIILKHFRDQTECTTANCVVIGDLAVLQENARALSIEVECFSWKPGDRITEKGIPVYNVTNLDPQNLCWGKPNRQTGLAMARYIETAVELARDNRIDGIVTCPISKAALQKAGYSYPGHTEMLADLTGEKYFTMMMAGPKLRVTLVTIHCSLLDSIKQLDSESILQRIAITHSSLVCDFNIKKPKIAVAGLNPHAGEENIFGDEESTIILPAINEARRRNIDAQGPFAPDTIFIKGSTGFFDAVVCMYHDQGLIPFKLLHFNDGVNLTIGLSMVRTSVDHGTAYDIAGCGIASGESLAAAIALAGQISANRKKNNRSAHQLPGTE